jgi:plasmid segregation protein ParM
MDTLPTVYLGLDLGFGDVKLVAGFESGQSNYRQKVLRKFPTAVAYAKDGIIGDLGDSDKTYSFNGRQYLVGASALQCRDVFSTRDINFLMTFSPLLAFTAVEGLAQEDLAFGEILQSGKRKVCLGMPLGYFHSRQSLLADAVKECHVSGAFLKFAEVEVRAQGQGILFDFMSDENGSPLPERLHMNILIVDIGFNTVDILGVVNGSSSREWSGMIERGGISRICQQVGDYLQREFSFDLPEQSLKDVLIKREITLYGATKDVSEIIRKASEEYSDWLIQEVRSRWDGFLQKADKLIIAGGGVYYVRDDLSQKYPKDFLYIPDMPEYSNAMGFYKYLEGKNHAEQDE